MKKSFLFLLFCASFLTDHAQPGTWTWLRGDSAVNYPGNFGVQGVASPTNDPPAMRRMFSFTDQNGKLWFYGGQNSAGIYNDIWCYDPLTNQWTWINGPGVPNDTGNFGTQGVPSINNRPPAQWGGAYWFDGNGDFWLYGGSVPNQLDPSYDDLWKYSTSTNMWTWIKGSGIAGYHTPSYGNIGIANPFNSPGGRNLFPSQWVDSNNNLWLFGGRNLGASSDLWKYNPVINQWTWVNGPTITNSPGSFGTLGVPSLANAPRARYSSAYWKDNNGNFWLFGGMNTSTNYDDMWMYNPATNIWTWMSGSNQLYTPGVYGTICIPSANNVPPRRSWMTANITDSNNNLWSYGGSNISKTYGDLWKFNSNTPEWTFSSGHKVNYKTAVYGSLGQPSASNKPGCRMGSVMWYDPSGYIYLFGGWDGIQTPGYKNDFWRYEIDPSCGVTSTGIEEYEKAPGLVTPNPNNGHFIIEDHDLESTDAELKIYNRMGQQVYTGSYKKGRNEIELNLNSGVYFIELTSGKKYLVEKFMIIR